MKFSLVMIGAHDGSKTSSFIHQCASSGNVLLIEPVSYLFEKLSARFSGIENIICLNDVISDVDGHVDFYVPTPDCNEIAFYGDQLGYLIADHAELHHPMFKTKIRKVKHRSRTMNALVEIFDIDQIDVLWTDMEGYDATFLTGFPFDLVKPREILFEAKHSDGMMKVGKKLATLLLLLDDLKYSIKMQDKENFLASLRPDAAAYLSNQ